MQGKRLVAYGLFFAALFLMFLLMSLGKRLDHDEHQFVASGALLARRGLWPYRDYAYFHMPNLAIINAIAFGVSDHLLLSSRLVSMTAGLLTTVLIFFAVRGAFGFAPRVRDGAAALAVLALVCNPIFITTTGRAWNHDLPTFLTVAAFLCAVRGLRRDRSTLMVGLSGALLGLAIGTRLTFAPAALSFGAMVAIAPGKSPRAKAGLILVLGAGIAVALLPSWVLFAQAPREFIFGNFTYASLNTRFHEEGGLGRGMTLPGKLGYVFSDLLIKPGNLLLFMALAASLAGVWKYKRRTPHPHRFEMLSLIFVIGGLLVGSFAPAPLFPVYFYEPVPFAVLLVAYAAAGAPGTGAAGAGARWKKLVAAAALLSIVLSIPQQRGMANPFDRGSWVPLRVHQTGMELAAITGPGRVLTYSPIFPLEGKAEIYEELATGPFAARAARLVPEADELRFKLADEEDWRPALRRRAAAAILSGFEGTLDDDLVASLPKRRLRETTLSYQGKPLHVYLWLPKHRRSEPAGVASSKPARTSNTADGTGDSPRAR